MNNSKMANAKNWILLGIPVLIIMGFVMHFIYEWTSKLVVVGIFAPINESGTTGIYGLK